MIEPTESEGLKEIDRFCSAMLTIADEILEIESNVFSRDNNVIINAPHTLNHLIIREWDKPYTKEKAAYPYKNKTSFKFWSPVSRINNAYGDKNLICSCSLQEDDLNEEKKCA